MAKVTTLRFCNVLYAWLLTLLQLTASLPFSVVRWLDIVTGLHDFTFSNPLVWANCEWKLSCTCLVVLHYTSVLFCCNSYSCSVHSFPHPVLWFYVVLPCFVSLFRMGETMVEFWSMVSTYLQCRVLLSVDSEVRARLCAPKTGLSSPSCIYTWWPFQGGTLTVTAPLYVCRLFIFYDCLRVTCVGGCLVVLDLCVFVSIGSFCIF